MTAAPGSLTLNRQALGNLNQADGTSYRTSSPVTALPMSILWISEVPSKVVKAVILRGMPRLNR
jgi:hypothetical protein